MNFLRKIAAALRVMWTTDPCIEYETCGGRVRVIQDRWVSYRENVYCDACCALYGIPIRRGPR
jgi:hypothetical protein